MNESISSRAPFECVCGFTAGTSFAWEKHLALRNTPYSAVKHTRVLRGGQDSAKKSSNFSDSPHGSLNGSHDDGHILGGFPTPKALFRDRSNHSLETPTRTQVSSPKSPILNGLHLDEAASSGDMDRVARLAVEILRLAQQGDSQGVLDLVTDKRKKNDHESRHNSSHHSKSRDIRFSANITAVHHDVHGVTLEQVATGLKNSRNADTMGARDALRLLAITEPLLDASSTSNAPAQFGVDVGVLKRTIISVAQSASRITAGEPRILETRSPVYVLGDVHGNLNDLEFFRKSFWPLGPEVTAGDFLFLGDFVDRGRDSIAVVSYIMSMKVMHPNKWWMIRGNHETREVNGNMEHYMEGSFLSQCIALFGDTDGYAVWEAVNNFFDTLPLAATIDDTIFCVHGGIPRALCRRGSSLDMIRNVECPLRSVQSNEVVYEMLWSDPSLPEQEQNDELDEAGFGVSARGCTCFGEKSIDLFLDIHRFKHVFRGHEAQQSGVGVSKSARLTTIFSTSKDHFSSDVTATCGCVLVDHDTIHPIVRALPSAGLKPTYAGQSVEAQEAQFAHGEVPHRFHGSSSIGSLSLRDVDSSRWSNQGEQKYRRAWEPNSISSSPNRYPLRAGSP